MVDEGNNTLADKNISFQAAERYFKLRDSIAEMRYKVIELQAYWKAMESLTDPGV